MTLLLTEDLTTVNQDAADEAVFRIGAGCFLGANLWARAKEKDSACYLVEQAGYAFPDLGGIIRQTVGGFMMTGSAGGSLTYGFADAIEKIEFVNGNGDEKVATKNDKQKDLWHAVGVSMGLFGVITYVTFRLDKTYRVTGKEENLQFNGSVLNGKPEDLKTTLEKNHYFRLNWFPQRGVNRVMQWSGQLTRDATLATDPYEGPLMKDPKLGFLKAFGSFVVLQLGDRILLKEQINPLHYCFFENILKLFVPLDAPAETFCDLWYKTLPTDNQAPIETLTKTDFTEIWVPLKCCQTVVDQLRKYVL